MTCSIDGRLSHWVVEGPAGHAVESCQALRDLAAVDPSRLSAFAKEAALLAEEERCTAGL